MKPVTGSFVKKLFPRRPEWSHKGDFGKVLVIGGNNRYSGSPAFSAMAAYRAGADMVTVAAPERAANITASFSPDMITYPLDGDFLRPEHLKKISMLSAGSDAVVIGGGLGTERETTRAVLSFLQETRLPCVVDADAISAVSQKKEIIRENWVLTPHTREFEILTKEKPYTDLGSRMKLVRFFASGLGTTILLKGHVDVISDGKEVFINKTGNPCMTKGGTGDILSGICGALLAAGAAPVEAACASAYINGAAGDLAAREHGCGMMASDMLELITEAIAGQVKK
jgi:hydroxyethylthiazole kinase-like uncharacterized protein yjeF